MMERFVHPNDGYAQQVHFFEDKGTKKAGTYFFREYEGVCTHTPRHTDPKTCDNKTPAIFTSRQMVNHLSGKKTYAPYQISEDNTVKWVCIDIDAYDDAPDEEVRGLTLAVARNMHRILGAHHCLVEQSGSKGYHVWVFFDEPLEAYIAYALGHKIIRGLPNTELISIEVYPKQHTRSLVGNTVKLPLGIHQKTQTRCLFVNTNFEPHEDQWSTLRDVEPVSVAWVREHIEAYEPEEQTQYHTETDWAPLCLVEALEKGVRQGIRDEAAFRLVNYLRAKGFGERYAHPVIEEWNTLNHPPLDQEQLDMKIAQGYGDKQYAWNPCSNPAFDHLCKSSCPFWKRKVKLRWSQSSGNPVGVISRE